MNTRLQTSWRAVRWLFAGVGSFLLWTGWLLLSLLLVLQIWWLRSNDLAVPEFALRALEDRLAVSSLRAGFGATHFDPAGRIVIENLSLRSTAFAEPLATARTIDVRLDPWALLVGRFEPEELELAGVTLYEPAMFSASGRPEALLSDLNATVSLRGRSLDLQQVNARLGSLEVAVSGTLPVPVWQGTGEAPLPIADFLSRQYPRLAREIADQLERLSILESPELRLALSPAEDGSVQVNARLLASGARLDQPIAAQARNLDLSTRFDFRGNAPVALELEASADELRLPEDTVAERVEARLNGTLQPETRSFAAGPAVISADRVESGRLSGAALSPVYVTLQTAGNPLEGYLATAAPGATLAGNFRVDLDDRSGTAAVRLQLGDALIDLASRLAGRDLRPEARLGQPIDLAADVRAGPGWNLESVVGHVDVSDLTAHGVHLDEARGDLHFDGSEFQATGVTVRQGENEVQGSYGFNLKSNAYRFLLTGQLRPGDIAPWFPDWWMNIFSNFDFQAAVPRADVDAQGVFRSPELATSYLSVDARSPAIHGVKLDRVQTVLNIHHEYTEGLSFTIDNQGGHATGSFLRTRAPVSGEMAELTYRLDATGIDLQTGARIFGDTGLRIVEPFRFSSPPDLHIAGRFDTDDAPDGRHLVDHIEGSTPDPLTIYDFPVSNATFTADVRDSVITIHPKLGFADGTGDGEVVLSGTDDNRRVKFDYKLQDARLGPAVSALESYSALRNGTQPAEKSAYLEKAADVQVNVSAQAEGPSSDLYALQGQGQAELVGSQLGEIHLLGLLSNLVTVTSLRFTRLQTSFQINKTELAMPDLKLTGANSAIEARGVYDLRRRDLSFTGKIYPFGESSNVLQLLDVLTRPLSESIEVHLSGTLDKPSWILVPTLLSPNPLKNGDTGGGEAPASPANSSGQPAAPAPTAPEAPEQNGAASPPAEPSPAPAAPAADSP